MKLDNKRSSNSGSQIFIDNIITFDFFFPIVIGYENTRIDI